MGVPEASCGGALPRPLTALGKKEPQRAPGEHLLYGLSPDFSHDGTLTPQVLETEAQEAVNDKGCQAEEWGGRQ